MAVNIPVQLPASVPGAATAAAAFKGIGASILTTADRLRKVTQFAHDLGRILGTVGRIAEHALAPAFEAGAARIQEVWTPVLKAVGEAFSPVTEAVRGLIEKNKELIAIKMVEFFKNAGGVLLDVFGFAVTSAATALEVLKKGWNTLVAGIASAGATIESIPLFGNPAMAARWRQIGAGAAQGFNDAGVAADKLRADIIELTARAAKYIDLVDPGKVKVPPPPPPKPPEPPKNQNQEFLLAIAKRQADYEAYIGRVKQLDREAHEARQNYAEQRAAWEHTFEEMRIADSNRAWEAEQRRIEGIKQKNADLAQSIMQVGQAAFDSIATSMLALAQGTTTAGKALMGVITSILRATLQSIVTAIQALAFKAAAEATTFSMALGPIGLALSAGFAGAAASAVLAYADQVPRAQRGLINPSGGTVGRDSVLALVDPDEAVVPLGLAARERDNGRAAVNGRGRASGVTINIVNQVATSEIEQARFFRRNLVPALMRLGYGR